MTIEITAKKVDDAIKEGLAQLGATLDQVTVEVLESGGLFRKAKVRLTLDAPEEAKAEVKAEAKVEEQKPEAAVAKTAPKAEAAAAPKAAKEEKPQQKQNAAKTDKPQKQAKAAEKPAKKSSKNDEAPHTSAQSGSQDGQRVEQKGEGEKNRQGRDGQGKRENAQVAPSAKKSQQKPQGERRKKTEEELKTLADALLFVKATVEKMGFDVTVAADENDPEHINITAPDGDDSLIIGRHGETLSALSYLAETCARAEKMRINVTVDCNGYRDRRAASLTAMARRRANECVAKRRKIKLEPMERIDRRTIHNALGDDDRVSTSSEGKEPYRYVVIFPARGERAPKREAAEAAGDSEE